MLAELLISEQAHNDQTLLQRLSEGDASAFATLYETYAPALTGFVAARLGSLEEARDIIHDLFVYLWEERTSIVITRSIEAFLFAAVRYRIIDHIRRNSTRRDYAGMIRLLETPGTAGTTDALDEKDLRGHLEKAIDQLPPRVKQIYRLSRDQHRTVAEIADELRLSQQTVRNQLTTALSHLRSFLGRLPFWFW
jgi:RNA polymerase sigma-70 factor (ECF subfamily)